MTENIENPIEKNKLWLQQLLVPAAIIIAGIIIAGAIFITNNKSSNQVTTIKQGVSAQPAQPAQPAPKSNLNITDQDHIRGNKSAPVTIVEFSDMQCPFCKRFHPTVKQALQEYGDKVRWVYKHFPLDSIHPEARPAAEASECVWEQKGDDGFWQFVDGVFENQNRIGSDLYRELAKQIGVNMDQFEQCVKNRTYQQKVENQYQEGILAGVRGTPGNFVNGSPLPGAVPYQTLKAAIEGALNNLK